jgi:uncharacterized repeat protein (TIGR01451 family)
VADPNLLNNTNAWVIGVTPLADLAVGKTGPSSSFLNANFSYIISVTNFGPSIASALSVTDNLPAGLAFVSASPVAATNLNSQVVWTNLGDFASGTITSLTLNVTATSRGILTNIAYVGSPAGDPNLSNNVSTPVFTAVTNRPPIAVNDSYTTGQNTTLVVPSASGVLTNDTDPDGDSLVAVLSSGTTHGVLTLNADGSFTYTPTNNFTGVDSFTYVANDGTTNSGLATVTVTITPTADIAIFKAGPSVGVAGSNLVYTITVTNNGPSLASNVVVLDQLPVGLTFVSAVPATATVTNNIVGWPSFNLATGIKTNFTVTAVSLQGGTFTNIASGTSSTFDPNPTNNNGTATNSQVITTVSPLADIAVFKTGGTNVASGGTMNYTITVTNIGPSTATNVVVQDTLPASVLFQNASGGVTPVGNVVTWPAMILTNGAATNFTVTVTAPSSGNFTNIASGTAGTPDPNPTNNNGTLPGSKVTTTVVSVADVQIFVSGPTNVTVGDGFSYTILVTNAGPATAISTLVTNLLPTNVLFASASGGGLNTNNVVTWPVIPLLTNGQATNLILTVTPLAGASTITTNTNPFNFVETNTTPSVGFLTNKAAAFATTFDPNLTNNSASSAYTNAQVQTVIVPGVFSIFIATNTYPTNEGPGFFLTNTITPIGANLFIVGTSAWNPVTQLYEENVSVTNVGTASVYQLRLYVGGLRSGVTLYNATGTNNIGPYVQYDPPSATPLTQGASVTFLLEFYVANGLPFTNSLTAVASLAPVTGSVIGVATNNIQHFTIDNRNPQSRSLIQFASIPGRTYTIEYSPDLVTWYVVVPSIVASANSTAWYDDGPPKTLSKPFTLATPTRYYRVLLDP